jgi:hypothetical protein
MKKTVEFGTCRWRVTEENIDVCCLDGASVGIAVDVFCNINMLRMENRSDCDSWSEELVRKSTHSRGRFLCVCGKCAQNESKKAVQVDV